ncbi:MAG TPA: ABC transporter permease [Nitrolancea sp.]|nr:ABC transporter permease [Nitrolancea sp.]
MGRYVVKRLLQAIPLLIGISIVVFLMIYLAPGDAAEFAISQRANEQQVQEYRHYLGLDLPWYRQYLRLVGNWAHGNLGTSIIQRRPVSTIIWERLPRTVELIGLSTIFALMLAIPIGIISAVRQYSLVDHVVTVTSFIGIAIPSFWLAIMMILLFSVKLHWFPTSGTQTIGQPFNIVDHLKHLVMPVTVLTVIQTAGWSRYMRSSMLEVLQQDYVRTAHSKGLPARRVLFRHAFRNALMPIITLLGLSLPTLVGGAIITEQIFAWNGLGQLTVTSASQRDTPVVMTIVMMSAIAIVIGNLLADICYRFVDPRIEL